VERAGDLRAATASPSALIQCQQSLNLIRDLDPFFKASAAAVPFGGYLLCRYVPLTETTRRLAARYGSGLGYRIVCLTQFLVSRAWPKIPRLNALYFLLLGRRGRILSKVEVWGRLSYAGLRVIAESAIGDDTWVLAQRVSHPATKKNPSYYPVVALEKVGLDGEPIYLHKVRSMYPYSEFLQQRIFEDHGLSSTGKFANDFRLTEYGPFLRRYWLDELPQIFDWLRGSVKLVGMRATSRHYLSLYPAELIDLYLRTKPGLIPPIVDESTPGFDKIVETELRYLRRYQQAPTKTDVEYFFKTFSDIFLRGVRSK
jgi:lipopolysaccharide/colanic/teichoic acid biosynthesis glycosyltransferase